MTPAEWAAHVEAHQRKEARRLAWECRLHGLKHRNGRAITEADFLPKPQVAHTPEAFDWAAAADQWQAPRTEYR